MQINCLGYGTRAMMNEFPPAIVAEIEVNLRRKRRRRFELLHRYFQIRVSQDNLSSGHPSTVRYLNITIIIRNELELIGGRRRRGAHSKTKKVHTKKCVRDQIHDHQNNNRWVVPNFIHCHHHYIDDDCDDHSTLVRRTLHGHFAQNNNNTKSIRSVQ